MILVNILEVQNSMISIHLRVFQACRLGKTSLFFLKPTDKAEPTFLTGGKAMEPFESPPF